MLVYAIRRLGLTVLILLVTMTLLFSMVYLVPGDPASVALGPRATAAMKATFRARMGLDDPLLVQLWRFISNVLRGDLGIDVWSKKQGRPSIIGRMTRNRSAETLPPPSVSPTDPAEKAARSGMSSPSV